jgi:hypothetical protein
MAARKKSKKARKGKRLTKTGKYLMRPKKGKEREFTGTLVDTINYGKLRLAVFKVPKSRI